MKRKILALCLIICLLAIAVVGGTLAYFTDSEEETNTFTVGNVDIRLLESKLHRANDNATDEAIEEDAETYQDYLAEQGADLVPGEWVLKAPYVVNDSKTNAAFVRVRVRFEQDEALNLDFMETTSALEDGSITKEMALITGDSKTVVTSFDEVKAAAAFDYLEYTYTYETALEPGEMTHWPAFWKFCVKNQLDSEDLENVTLDKIVVYADAIQAQGFDTAEKAFAAFDDQEG